MKLSKIANRLVWGGMFIVILMLGYQFKDTIGFLSTGTLTVSESETDPDTIHLRWVGEVGPAMTGNLRDSIPEWRGRKRRVVLELSSPGGSVADGAAVVRMLRDLRRTHELETVVRAGENCLSMCVPIYLQGAKRVASPRSRWMFHEVRVRDAFDDDDPGRRDGRSTDKLFENFFKPEGVTESWITVTRHAMRKGDVWRTGQALVDEKSGIIHTLQ